MLHDQLKKRRPVAIESILVVSFIVWLSVHCGISAYGLRIPNAMSGLFLVSIQGTAG